MEDLEEKNKQWPNKVICFPVFSAENQIYVRLLSKSLETL